MPISEPWPEGPFTDEATVTKAPSFPISSRDIVSIEHPLFVQDLNIDAASFGGLEKMNSLVSNEADAIACLHYKPHDRYTKSLHSSNVETRDLLMKITVPKRTGRKLKRARLDFNDSSLELENHGLSKDQTVGNATEQDVSRLIRSLRDNPDAHKIELVGKINRTHRFRGMADLAQSKTNASFMKKMEDTILPFKYEKMKSFRFDMSRGVVPNAEIIPPPSWSHYEYPFNYAYRQNPAISYFFDEQGRIKAINKAMPTKVLHQSLPPDIPNVPDGPAAQMPPTNTLDLPVQQLIAEAIQALESRPIFTRRVLRNALSREILAKIGSYSEKQIYPYVGYSFTSGPWRDAIIKFGVDPRKDPSYRIYQTMMFLTETESQADQTNETRSSNSRKEIEQVPLEKSHLFDGNVVSKDCKVWQVCDISDPIISKILATTNLRPECQLEGDGWYWNGTWATAKILTKAMMSDILLGKPPKRALYKDIAKSVPDVIRRSTSIAKPKGTASPDEMRLLASIRATATAVAYKQSRALAPSELPTISTPDLGENAGLEEEEEALPQQDVDMIDPHLETGTTELAGGDLAAGT